MRANVPALTPSLANYYKETLISHVQGWPAEGLEKQVMPIFLFFFYKYSKNLTYTEFFVCCFKVKLNRRIAFFIYLFLRSLLHYGSEW